MKTAIQFGAGKAEIFIDNRLGQNKNVAVSLGIYFVVHFFLSYSERQSRFYLFTVIF